MIPRIINKIFNHKTRVRSGYKIKFYHRKWDEIRKEFSNDKLYKECFIDNDEHEEILYMLGVYLTDPTVKIYVVYNDGSERRIKVGKLIRRLDLQKGG